LEKQIDIDRSQDEDILEVTTEEIISSNILPEEEKIFMD
jgi:hypothetical protein